MQTIYAYNYTPTFTVVLPGSATINKENFMFYQHPINLYKGTPNTIKLHMRNQDQKAIDITGNFIEVMLVDRNLNVRYITKIADIVDAEAGQVTVTFTEDDLNLLDARYYQLLIRKLADDQINDPSSLVPSIVYSDDHMSTFIMVSVENAWNFTNAT